jgi:hypothetical protein
VVRKGSSPCDLQWRPAACVPEERQAAAFKAGRLLLFASKQGPCIYPAIRRPSSTCVRRDRRRTAGRTTAVRRGTRSHTTGAKGNRLLVPRGGGAWPARTPSRQDAQRAAQGCQADRRRSRARLIHFSAGQPYFDCAFLQKIELCDKNGRYESCR